VDSYPEEECAQLEMGAAYSMFPSFKPAGMARRLSWGPKVVICNCELRKLVSLEQHGPVSVKHFQLVCVLILSLQAAHAHVQLASVNFLTVGVLAQNVEKIIVIVCVV